MSADIMGNPRYDGYAGYLSIGIGGDGPAGYVNGLEDKDERTKIPTNPPYTQAHGASGER
jgi:hypothetical protein